MFPKCFSNLNFSLGLVQLILNKASAKTEEIITLLVEDKKKETYLTWELIGELRVEGEINSSFKIQV